MLCITGFELFRSTRNYEQSGGGKARTAQRRLLLNVDIN